MPSFITIYVLLSLLLRQLNLERCARLNGAKHNPFATKKTASSIQNYTHIKGNVE
jgi:hypothetical protein